MENEYLLEIENVTKEFPGIKALPDVSFKIRKGEIHGLCGENGAGKSTLMKILSRVYPYESYSGRVLFHGEELKFTHASIRQAIEKGIAIVYQELTLVPRMTVGENIFLGREPHKPGGVDWNKLYSNTEKILKKYSLDIPFSAKIINLGIGKQQLVEIAKALSENAKLLILDEPTRGIDVGSKYEIYKLINSLSKEGVAIIMVSSKLPEILGMSDRIMVMHNGKCKGILDREEATQEKIMTPATGLKYMNEVETCPE